MTDRRIRDLHRLLEAEAEPYGASVNQPRTTTRYAHLSDDPLKERAVRRLRTALALDRLPEPPPPPSLDSYRRVKHGATP